MITLFLRQLFVYTIENSKLLNYIKRFLPTLMMKRAKIQHVVAAVCHLRNSRGVTLSEVKRYMHEGYNCYTPLHCKLGLQTAVNEGFLLQKNGRYFPTTETAGILEARRRRRKRSKSPRGRRQTKRQSKSRRKTRQRNVFGNVEDILEALGTGSEADFAGCLTARRRMPASSRRKSRRRTRHSKTRRNRKPARSYSKRRGKRREDGVNGEADEDSTQNCEEPTIKTEECLSPPQ